MSDDLRAGIELIDAFRQIVERNKISAKIAYLVFVRLAHIEYKKFVAGIQTALEIFDANLRNTCCHGLLLTTNSTKLVVVYQFCDGAVRPADRAIRILMQLQLAELHAQCVD